MLHINPHLLRGVNFSNHPKVTYFRLYEHALEIACSHVRSGKTFEAHSLPLKRRKLFTTLYQCLPPCNEPVRSCIPSISSSHSQVFFTVLHNSLRIRSEYQVTGRFATNFYDRKIIIKPFKCRKH